MKLRLQARSRIAVLREQGDRGMLSMVIIVVIIGMGLGALLVPMIVTQSQGTSHTDARVQALDQAEAGIDAMLGRLRGATTDSGVSTLPCYESGSPLTWRLASSTTGYDVTLQYFTSDPLKVVTSTGVKPPPLSCSTQYLATNTYPTFARITSVGTDTIRGKASTRTLSTTYAFNTTSATMNGGQIRFNPNGVLGPPQCLNAAGGAYPAPGTALSVGLCIGLATPVTPALQAQLFFYNSDLSLRLLYSTTVGAPYGLCVDSGTGAPDVSLQPCSPSGSATYRQQWGLDDNAAFVQTRPPDASRVCLAVPAGATVVKAPCSTGYDPLGSWLPTPSTGGGASGAASGQLVNLSQFGRCAQVTNQVVPSSAPNPFMILYPCTQDPLPSQVGWYQKFAYNSGTQKWVTTSAGVDYCLTSTGTTNGYVTVQPCDTNQPRNALQKWTQFGVTAADQANASQWPYAQRYTIVNSGLCLSLSPTSGTSVDWFVDPTTHLRYSKVTSDVCDGSARQKWNADPQTSVITSTTEK
jgi:hypothetical protein